jgi:hypothetical protein
MLTWLASCLLLALKGERARAHSRTRQSTSCKHAGVHWQVEPCGHVLAHSPHNNNCR